MAHRYFAFAAIAAGILFHVYFYMSQTPGLSFSFFLYSCLPYFFACALLLLAPSYWQALGAAVAALLFDLLIYGEAFLWPHGSTAALGVMVAPLWQLFLIAPLGALVGHIIHAVRPSPIP